jgi:hypothetical protein
MWASVVSLGFLELTYNGILFSLEKKKEFTSHIKTWGALRHYAKCMSQSQKDKYSMNPLIWSIQSSQTHSSRLGMVVHTYNTSSLEAEARGLKVWGQYGLHSENPSQSIPNKIKC